jgi:hypothetical protein
MARKFVFVLSRVFLRNYVYMQAFIPALAALMNLVVNLYSCHSDDVSHVCRLPYKEQRHNIIETIILAGLMTLSLLGLLNPTDLTKASELKRRVNRCVL